MVKLVEFDIEGDASGIVDDVAIYMRNEPVFYRKKLFPAVMRMKDLRDAKKNVDPNECLGSVVGNAMVSYCDKFQLGSPKNVFKKGDKKLIIDKVFAEEMTQIKNGAY